MCEQKVTGNCVSVFKSDDGTVVAKEFTRAWINYINKAEKDKRRLQISNASIDMSPCTFGN